MHGAAAVVACTVPEDDAERLLELIRSLLFTPAREVAGYQGVLVLDQGEGRRMGVGLCDSVESALALQRTIGPAAAEQNDPLMSPPSIGTISTVLARGGVFSAP